MPDPLPILYYALYRSAKTVQIMGITSFSFPLHSPAMAHGTTLPKRKSIHRKLTDLWRFYPSYQAASAAKMGYLAATSTRDAKVKDLETLIAQIEQASHEEQLKALAVDALVPWELI